MEEEGQEKEGAKQRVAHCSMIIIEQPVMRFV